MQQIVSGIHDILQKSVRQDICFDSKNLIHQERNAVDLYDQCDSKGQMSFISFKEGFLKDHLVGKEHQLLVRFPAYHLLHAMRS